MLFKIPWITRLQRGLFWITACLLILFTAGHIYQVTRPLVAESVPDTIEQSTQQPDIPFSVVVNHVLLNFPFPPFYDKELLFVPLQHFLTVLGYSYHISPGSNQVTTEKDGASASFELPLQYLEGHVYGSLEHLSEQLGFTIDHDNRSNRVDVSYPSVVNTGPLADRSYIHFSDQTRSVLDEKGIPMFDYGVNGIRYNPLQIASWYYNRYYYLYSENRENPIYQKAYFRLVNWLEDNAVPFKANSLVWWIQFDFGPNRAPWYSGLSQGRIAEAFIRTLGLTDDEKYLILAQKALNAMLIPTSEGGVLHRDSSDDIWIQEDYLRLPSYILNGHMSAVISLIHVNKIVRSPDIQATIDELILSLADKLPLFDNGANQSSNYDLMSRDVRFQLHLLDKTDSFSVPIDEITLVLPDDPDISIDVGSPGDTYYLDSMLIVGDRSTWQAATARYGRSCRLIGVEQGKSADVALFPIGNREQQSDIFLKLTYFDLGKGKLAISVCHPSKDCLRFGSVDLGDEKKWKTAVFKLPLEYFPGGLGTPASSQYHRLHIRELKTLYEYSKNPVLLEYIERWQAYSGELD